MVHLDVMVLYTWTNLARLTLPHRPPLTYIFPSITTAVAWHVGMGRGGSRVERNFLPSKSESL